MGFPFLAPLKKWTTDKLEAREKNKEALNTLMPFVVMSSAAVVTNTRKTSEELKALYASKSYDSFAYKGCVIANSTDILKNYQLGETIVGYDLDGKPIKVQRESNRRVSMPIIESLEIDTDGGNNTLKTAQVKIRIFTLKQLEMFELFFLRPGMNVVLEYGWNASIREKIDITTHMFANKSHKDYLQKYSEIFSHKDNAYREAKGKYIATIKNTDGNYDFMAGKVTNFNYTPQADGTYDISLEISAGNELQLWMPVKQSKSIDKDDPKSKKALTPYETWVNKLSADLNNPNFVDLFKDKNIWEKEFFNWGSINITQKDTTFSKDAYISFYMILEIINNMKVFKSANKTINWAHYETVDRNKPIIPISSDGVIMSSTIDFILPGDLPEIKIQPKKNKQQKDIIVLNPQKKTSCLINGKRFNISNSNTATPFTIYDEQGANIELTSMVGNLLNLYFRFETFVSVYMGAYTAADVVNSLLDTINANMYGLCKLELQKESDVQSGSPLIIIDRKLKIPKPTESIEKIWRFKVGALNSIVKEFNFNMELSTLMQAQALYSSQLAINSAINKTNDGKSVVPVNDPYQAADLSYAKNSDGFYSVNAIEIQIVSEAQEWNKKIEDATQSEKSPPITSEESEENVAEVRNRNFVKFKLNPLNTKETPIPYIYTDAALIQNNILTNNKKNPQSTALTYLDITLAIDGIAGISCGEYFHIDGVPEIYNKNGYFQVTNVKQGIDSNGWKTTIEAGYRINTKENDV